MHKLLDRRKTGRRIMGERKGTEGSAAVDNDEGEGGAWRVFS